MRVGLEIQKRVALGARKVSRWRDFLGAHRDGFLLAVGMVKNFCDQRIHVGVGGRSRVLNDRGSCREVRSEVLISTVCRWQIIGIALSQSICELFFDLMARAMLVRARELRVDRDLLVGAGSVRPALFRSRRRAMLILVE